MTKFRFLGMLHKNFDQLLLLEKMYLDTKKKKMSLKNQKLPRYAQNVISKIKFLLFYLLIDSTKLNGNNNIFFFNFLEFPNVFHN